MILWKNVELLNPRKSPPIIPFICKDFGDSSNGVFFDRFVVLAEISFQANFIAYFCGLKYLGTENPTELDSWTFGLAQLPHAQRGDFWH